MLTFGINTVYILIAFFTLSLIIAMISTNIHKNAISKFITYLCNNNIFDENNAKTLSEMKIAPFSALVIRGSLRGSNGISNNIGIVASGSQSDDKLEALLEGKSEYRYYLKNTETQALIKRYSYKPLSLSYMLLFVAAIIVTAILSTVIVENLLTSRTKPGDVNKNEEEQHEELEDNNQQQDSVDVLPNQEENEDVFLGPTIPV